MDNSPALSTIIGSDRDSTIAEWTGFKIVIDNLDKSIKPSFQRLDRSNQLLHFVQMYAVLDRVDFSGLSDSEPVMLSGVNPLSLLPSDNDIKKLEDNCITMISRLVQANYLSYGYIYIIIYLYSILQTHMQQFCHTTVEHHISSQHTEKMSSQSKVVIYL